MKKTKRSHININLFSIKRLKHWCGQHREKASVAKMNFFQFSSISYPVYIDMNWFCTEKGDAAGEIDSWTILFLCPSFSLSLSLSAPFFTLSDIFCLFRISKLKQNTEKKWTMTNRECDWQF